ncbi:hypothetical protein BOTCAL_0175g00020 [Botryotinia calthae]|uniref:Uncharacterized protein n=1 Tax=Botryotinia calthae TaxID=38488 RepID=A0A4Y8D122_9HELO|nr:hypothetical protein BOTCAL_0175g00020 [Botryotinia calthae]
MHIEISAAVVLKTFVRQAGSVTGEIALVLLREGKMIKVETKSLFGEKNHVAKRNAVTITQLAANSVEITLNEDIRLEKLNVNIVAPDRPVELLFTDCKNSLVGILLRLNQYASQKFRIDYNDVYRKPNCGEL